MTRLKRSDIPKDFEVQPLRPGQKAKEPATCGTCGLAWDDGKITGMTPAPSARCPFEAFHDLRERKPKKELSPSELRDAALRDAHDEIESTKVLANTTGKGGFMAELEEKPNRDLRDLHMILRAFCGFAHTIPTVGDDSFLVALPNKATFRIEIQPQAVPGNPPLNYCPCGRSIEKGATHCLNCISRGKNQNRIPVVF